MKLRFSTSRSLSVWLCLVFIYALLSSAVAPLASRTAHASSDKQGTAKNVSVQRIDGHPTLRSNSATAMSITQGGLRRAARGGSARSISGKRLERDKKSIGCCSRSPEGKSCAVIRAWKDSRYRRANPPKV